MVRAEVSPFKDPHRLATVVVHQAQVFAGASVEFQGAWVNHPRFGEQFRAVQVTLDSTPNPDCLHHRLPPPSDKHREQHHHPLPEVLRPRSPLFIPFHKRMDRLQAHRASAARLR